MTNGPKVQNIVQSWATENSVDVNINDDKLQNILIMKIIQTPINKSKQERGSTKNTKTK